jgi:hypothetical protein|tara:strand:+ start:108 stop:338 length:231 start_codon:yes stop_codon:yes gene_type:complete
MIIINPTNPPRTEWVRRSHDKKWIKWVEKPISSLNTDEPVTQVSPVSKTGERWLHDHYTWVIEDVVERRRKKRGKK